MDDDRLIIRGPLVMAEDIWDDAELVITGGKISAVHARPFHARTRYRTPDHLIAPGLIDTHIHGSLGDDVMDGQEAGLRRMAAYLASQGTTGFTPTTMSAPTTDLLQALNTVHEVMRSPRPVEAEILGVHMEGPFLSPLLAGAQNPAFLRLPDSREMRQYIAAAPVRLMTVAPELPGWDTIWPMFRQHGVIASLGHSALPFDEAKRVILEGRIRHATHLFNGMPPLHHRDPGPAGALLASPQVVCEIICDGIHVHPEWVRVASRLLGERLILVTDAMRATGLPDGQYDLGGQTITVRDGVARTGQGNLAGSTLTLWHAVRNFRAFTGCDWPTAFRAASLRPAVLLGMEHAKGSIAVGKDADLIWVDPDSGRVERTLVNGRLSWEADPS